jgi:hypothetical protein
MAAGTQTKGTLNFPQLIKGIPKPKDNSVKEIGDYMDRVAELFTPDFVLRLLGAGIKNTPAITGESYVLVYNRHTNTVQWLSELE